MNPNLLRQTEKLFRLPPFKATAPQGYFAAGTALSMMPPPRQTAWSIRAWGAPCA
jgi:hypothetical protein